MDRIPLSKLLEPCASDGRVGQNLEYDSRHIAMCEAAEGTPEQEYGTTLVAAEPPNWRELLKSTKELSIETRDLRVAVMMTESLCRLQGWTGLSDGLQVVSGWTTEFWDEVYPQLDESDGNDPVERLGVLARLSHAHYLLDGLVQLPLADDPTLGTVTLQDIRRNMGVDAAEGQADKLTKPEIEAIFLSASTDFLRTTGDHIQRCLEAVEQIEAFLNAKIGTGQWAPERLLVALRECADAVENAWGNRVGLVHQNQRQGPIDASHQTEGGSALQAEETQEATDGPSVPQNEPKPEQQIAITSRAEAMEVLDQLCVYFQKYEPASPVPLLLQRAKRLIPMSFVDILRELAPNGLDQAMQSVGALRDES
ncbi:MAG: type VI secretion system protein TssA [Planctomycetota bacterium]